MNKEKSFNELCYALKTEYPIFSDSAVRDIAKTIINTGFLRAFDVRTEIAKEIFQGLYDVAKESDYGFILIRASDIKEMAKNYGVEVNE